MRTFEKVELQSNPPRARARFFHVGILPVTDLDGCETPLILVEISFARYRAEQAAIRASEPISGTLLDDEQYFAVLAVERAQRHAQRLLKEMSE